MQWIYVQPGNRFRNRRGTVPYQNGHPVICQHGIPHRHEDCRVESRDHYYEFFDDDDDDGFFCLCFDDCCLDLSDLVSCEQPGKQRRK